MSSKRRKVVSDMLRNYELERIYSPEQQQIKSEPRDRTPPHHNISSPPLHAYAPQYDQNWGLENMQAGMGAPGPSHVNSAVVGHGNPFVQELWQNQPYGQLSPGHLQPTNMTQNLQVLQPNMQAMSPNMQAMSPNMQAMSPNMQAMSPNMQPMSPNMQPLSPNMQQQAYTAGRMSPNMNVLSPHAQSMSPGMHGATVGRVSPNMPQNMGHISPNLVQHQPPTYVQQQQAQQNLMETEGHSAASLTHLLLDRGDTSLLLNSSELSGLSALLGERAHEPQPLDY